MRTLSRGLGGMVGVNRSVENIRTTGAAHEAPMVWFRFRMDVVARVAIAVSSWEVNGVNCILNSGSGGC